MFVETKIRNRFRRNRLSLCSKLRNRIRWNYEMDSLLCNRKSKTEISFDRILEFGIGMTGINHQSDLITDVFSEFPSGSIVPIPRFRTIRNRNQMSTCNRNWYTICTFLFGLGIVILLIEIIGIGIVQFRNRNRELTSESEFCVGTVEPKSEFHFRKLILTFESQLRCVYFR